MGKITDWTARMGDKGPISVLLPCPFCGGSAVTEYDETKGTWMTQCESCGSGTCSDNNQIATETQWNQRYYFPDTLAIALLKESRECIAACFRTIAASDDKMIMDRLEMQLALVGVKNGIGVRLQNFISEVEQGVEIFDVPGCMNAQKAKDHFEGDKNKLEQELEEGFAHDLQDFITNHHNPVIAKLNAEKSELLNELKKTNLFLIHVVSALDLPPDSTLPVRALLKGHIELNQAAITKAEKEGARY
jgi:hypothetical protein